MLTKRSLDAARFSNCTIRRTDWIQHRMGSRSVAHHPALLRGVLILDDGRRLEVSPLVERTDSQPPLLNLHDQRQVGAKDEPVSQKFLEWHRQQVFKRIADGWCHQ